MRVAKLGEISLFVRNGKSVKQNDSLGGLPISRIETIAEGVINPQKVGFAGLGTEGNEEWLLIEGDILISHINSTKHLGKCAQYMGAPVKLIHGMNLLNLRCDQQVVYPRYVLHYLKSKTFLEQIPRITKNSVNQSSFTVSAFKELNIILPSLPEQKRIASILDKADAIRRKREEAIELTDSFLRSVFLEMFGDPVQNPKGWKTVKGSDLFKELKYGTSEKCSEVQSSNALPVLRIPNVLGESINLEDLKYADLDARERDKLILRDGDILFVRSNGNPNYIARCAVFEGTVPMLFASYLIRARLNERLGVESKFLRDLMSFPSYRSRLLKIARTTAGNYNMSTEGLRSLLFIQPPLDIQNRYLTIHQVIQRIKGKLFASLDRAEQLSNSLCSGLFKEPPTTLNISDGKVLQEVHAL